MSWHVAYVQGSVAAAMVRQPLHSCTGAKTTILARADITLWCKLQWSSNGGWVYACGRFLRRMMWLDVATQHVQLLLDLGSSCELGVKCSTKRRLLKWPALGYAALGV